MLYLYVIQKRGTPQETLNPYFLAACRCQSHLSAIAEEGSLSERYCLVLEELRLEALRQAERVGTATGTVSRMENLPQENTWNMAPLQMNGNPDPATNFADVMGDASMDFNEGPSTALSDYSDWDHFASMVASGLGNLDEFCNDGSFQF